MKLSIIVPVYNMAFGNKLNFCMDSLINQTIDDYEILAVNDASTDNSLEVLLEYRDKYPDKVKVITYPDNRHQGGARNEALKVALGDFISFVDSDDWVSPDYFEKMIEKAESTGADVVSCSFTNVSEHTFTPGIIYPTNSPELAGEIDHEKRKRLLLDAGSMMMKIYRRELIYNNSLSFPEHIFYEDNAAGPVWALYIKHLEIVDGPLYYYYQHSASTVHLITEDRCLNRMQASDIMLAETKKRGFFEDYSTEICALYTHLFFVNTMFSYMLGRQRKKLSFVRVLIKRMLEAFPDFRSNPYYFSITDSEQRKMIDLMIKSPFAFYVYYNLLWTYRRLKNNRGQE